MLLSSRDHNIYQVLINLFKQSYMNRSLSFLNESWSDLEAWKSVARAKLREILLPDMEPTFLNPTISAVRSSEDIIIEEISYELPYGSEVHSFFIYPKKRGHSWPAVIALHDHSGFKFFGKEKLVDIPNEPLSLREFKTIFYGGRSWASELARRGFAVLITDTFLFGSRKIYRESLNCSDLDDCIRKYNSISKDIENYAAKILTAIGLNVIGIIVYEDLVSLEYLSKRPEVDRSRIGVCGVSLGGLRAMLLSALDERIRCTVIAASMSTLDEIIEKGIEHAWTLYIPEVAKYFDFPDIAAIHMPNPMLVQYCEEDRIFPYSGQIKADEKLWKMYQKSGYPQNYHRVFYKKPHVFDVEMQEDAFKWLKGCLAV